MDRLIVCLLIEKSCIFWKKDRLRPLLGYFSILNYRLSLKLTFTKKHLKKTLFGAYSIYINFYSKLSFSDFFIIWCWYWSFKIGQQTFKVESGSDIPDSAMARAPKKSRKMFQKRSSSGTVTSFKKLQLSLLNTDLMRKACTGRASSALLPKKPIELARFPEYMEMIRKYEVILKTEFQVSTLMGRCIFKLLLIKLSIEKSDLKVE